MNIIFNIKQVEIGCVTFVSIQHDPLYKHVMWVWSYPPTSLTVRVSEEPWHDYWMDQVQVKAFSWILLSQHDTNPTH